MTKEVAGSLFRSFAPAVLTAIAVLVATASQLHYADLAANNPHRTTWFWVIVIAAALAAVTPLVDAGVRRARRLSAVKRVEKARTDQVLAVNDALDPLVEKLAEVVMTSPAQREAAAGQLITQALHSVSGVLRPDRVRVSYFEVDAAAEPVRVVCRESAGRHGGRPRTTFVEGNRDGDFVLDLLRKNESYFCADVSDSPPPGWDANRKRSYATFFSVPAVVGDDLVGMLTVDAPEVGDLAEQDVPFVRVIGTVIAASLKIAEGGRVG